MMNLFEELRRRKVFRTAAAYLAGAFVVLQVADLTFEPLHIPASAYRALIIVAALGFPVAVVLSWFFDLRREDVRIPRPARFALVAFVLLCTGAMAYGVKRHWTHADYDSRYTIAVLPFKVLGSNELAYMQNGIIEMLSRNVDGAANLRAIAPDQILTVAKNQTNTPDAAKKLDARFVVDGNITQLGDRVRITATVNDYKSKTVKSITRVVEGETKNLFDVVDRLSAQILSATRSGQDARMSETAALTTRSLPALKAYLLGEDLFRRTQYDSAIAQFSQATQLDTTFALAYYRLAMAYAENGTYAPYRDAVAGAKRHAARLPERDRMLVEGAGYLLDGNGAKTISTYKAILAKYPGDLEATYQLAGMTFFDEVYKGGDPQKAEPLFDQVLEADPEFLCPI